MKQVQDCNNDILSCGDRVRAIEDMSHDENGESIKKGEILIVDEIGNFSDTNHFKDKKGRMVPAQKTKKLKSQKKED